MSPTRRLLPSRRTPYDDRYPTCERVLAKLRIYGVDLDPATVTEQLQIEPTESQKKGEVRTNSLGRQRSPKIGGWFLSSEDKVASKDLRRHLDWLLQLLTPRADAICALQDTEGITMMVDCIWWSAHGDGGPTLWPEQMRALADLNLECSFDISFFGEDDEPHYTISKETAEQLNRALRKRIGSRPRQSGRNRGK